MEDENFKLTFIPEGLVVCLSSVQVSFLVIYGRCNRRGSKINRVVIEHLVNGKRASKRTERQWPYYLYGDIFKSDNPMVFDNATAFREAITINFSDAIEGNNTITSRANRGATKVFNFTVKQCPA